MLSLPARTKKPREAGWTVVIDRGAPVSYFRDVVESVGDLIDLVKFGWGTALVSPHLPAKIACLQERGIDYFFGGTLFEKFYAQGQLDAYVRYCRDHGCRYVEVSNGTIDMANADKARIIRDLAQEFRVLSEVGYKDATRSLNLHPARWIAFIEEDLGAGAYKTITEARESGTSGICRADGELRFGLIEEIIDSGVPLDRLVFEAPTKTLQTYFVIRLGANVNLANVALDDVVPLETLRLGLRSDTLEWSEQLDPDRLAPAPGNR
jgi:phosphosulfolactate synthase